MFNINSVCISGYLAEDPVLEEINQDLQVLKFALIQTLSKKVDGEWKQKPQFFDVKMMKGSKYFSKTLKQGCLCSVGGELRYEQWKDKNSGQNRHKVYILANNLSTKTPEHKQAERPKSQDNYKDIPF